MSQQKLLKNFHKTFRVVFPVRKEVGENSTEFKENLRRKIEFDLGIPHFSVLGTFQVRTATAPEPFASGVTVVQVAKDMQDLLWLRLGERCYDLEVKLGEYREAGTHESEIEDRKDFSHIDEELIRRTLPKFVGKIYQTFKSTNRLTSEVNEVDRPALCHEIQLKAFEPPFMRLQIRCGANFSPRLFAEAISLELGTVGYARRLHRFSQGPFTYDEALPSYAVTWDNCKKVGEKFADRLRSFNFNTRKSFSEEDLETFISERRLGRMMWRSRKSKKEPADNVAQ